VVDRCKLQVPFDKLRAGFLFAPNDRLWCAPVTFLRQNVEVFPSQPQLFAVELAESGEVQVVADLEQAGLEEEEGGDQRWVAADEAELAAKLLFAAGHVTHTPSPLPVREAAV
jgi:hypothetical protein